MEILSDIIAPLLIITGLGLSYIFNKKTLAPYFYMAGFALLAISAFAASKSFIGSIWLAASLFAVYVAVRSK